MTTTIEQKTTDTLTAAPPTAATATLETLTVARLIEGTIALLLALSNVSTVVSTVTSARSAPIASHAMIRALHVAIAHYRHIATKAATSVINPHQETEALRSLDSIRRVLQIKPSNTSSTYISVTCLCVACWTADRRHQVCNPGSSSTTSAVVTSSRILVKLLLPSTEQRVQSGALLKPT